MTEQYDRLPALAADLVRRPVAAIFSAGGISSALAAKAATKTVPIVFVTGIDPVEAGLVVSLNGPGGNVTGVANLNLDLMPKRLELLHELVPSMSTVAILVNPTSVITEGLLKNLNAAARTMGPQIHALHATTEQDFDKVFATVAELRTGGLVVSPDSFFISRGSQLGALTVHHAVPTISQFREFVAAGGLMSYGTSLTDAARLAGVYTGRILNGEKPTSLPIRQATKVELIINMKTAKALGLAFPLTLLGRADEVIE